MRMQRVPGVILLLMMLTVLRAQAPEAAPGPTVYVVPVRDDIATPVAYLVRRGVKAAMEGKADVLLLDMETDGGRLDSTQEIIESINQFKGRTATYVNRKAFSAGVFIAVATQEIYMAPQSVIGAAAPMLMGPAGGVEAMPKTVEAKMTSAVRALVRTSAEKNGYNTQVIDAMIDPNTEVTIDGDVINEKGEILTLTSVEAEKKYGSPPKPLLSSGTVERLEEVVERLGFGGAKIVRVEPTGAERLASWLNAIAPLLMLAGIAGIYIEMKTPGFGLPGIIGVTAFALYFLGGFVAGLSGFEWMVVFLLGLAFLILELFIFPGTLFLGLIGGVMMLAALVMAMVDIYPGMPRLPNFGQLREPLMTVFVTAVLAVIMLYVLGRYLLKTPLYARMVSPAASGAVTVARTEAGQKARLGEIGVTTSVLRPGGKGQFREQILDVISQGEMIGKGRRVRILSFSGHEAVVEELPD